MMLSVGRRLGPYEILAPLGAGGMGEVYRARDTRLDRVVAIKILSPQFSADAVHKQRFEREAKVISRLNHPHICVLYDVGHEDGLDYLVMEYVEGDTLARRLEKGPLPLEQVLKYGAQLAEALDKAHHSGVAHRDLKPGNIMLTPAGAKLLDFGLARPVTSMERIATLTAATSPAPVTEKGTIVGTFQYMAPEQLEGKDLDARTDIFSLGAVLYEMVTGQRAFQGKSQLSVASAILEKEPAPISTLKQLTPRALEHAIRRCLAKDPEERWQSARDLAQELKWIAEGGSQAGAVTPVVARRNIRERLAWGLVALLALALALVVALHFRQPQPEQLQIRYSFPASDQEPVGCPLSVSPDGRYLAIAGRFSSRSQLLLRALNSLKNQPLPGPEGAQDPFWSPDSRFIGFFAEGKLRKIAIAGGPAQTVCDAANGWGGTWNQFGTIVFTPSPREVLHSVPAAGGVVSPVTVKTTSTTTEGHAYPIFLPDGRHFLFVVTGAAEGKDGIYSASLDSKEPRRLLADVSNAQYAPSSSSDRQGYLLFSRENALLAQPFDSERLETTGEAFPVAEHLSRPWFPLGYFGFSASRNGVLTYLTGDFHWTSELLWFDREGKRIGAVGKPGTYGGVMLSPDEKRVGVTHWTSGDHCDIWVHELTRDSSSPFTFGPERNNNLVWSPDGSHIAFRSIREGSASIYQKGTSGASKEQLVFQGKSNWSIPVDWSHDGRFLIFDDIDPKAKIDIWLLPMTGEHKPVSLLPQIEFNQRLGQFSPDDRWVAYTSDQSGIEQIYVQPFPTSGGKWMVSTSGGRQPRWRRDGKELFYLAPDGKLMAVAIRADAKSGHFESGSPQALFQTGILPIPLLGNSFFYDVTADGRRFLINTVHGGLDQAINVWVNWQAGLKQ